MEEIQNSQEPTAEIYQYAARLAIGGKNSYEIKCALIEKGIDAQDAYIIAETVEQKILDAKKSRAQKDMLYGALWCIGGLGLTMAHIGFIFWGAILFGSIQFIRGVSNLG